MTIPGPIGMAPFFATVAAAGFGTAALLFSGAVCWMEFAAFAWLLGTFAVSLLVFAAGLFCPAPWNGLPVVAAVLALAWAGRWRLRQGALKLRNPSRLDPVEWVLVAAAAALALGYFAAFSHQSLGWDGLFIWQFKARIAFDNGGAIPAAYFTDPSRVWSHPAYPLFLPMLESWCYQLLGVPYEPALKWVLAPFYPAGAVLVAAGVRRLGGSRKAGLLAAALLIAIPYPFAGIGSLGSGYCDFPLAIGYLAAAAALLRSRPNRPLFALLAGMLPWIKREGLILWGCLMIMAFFLDAGEPAHRRLLRTLRLCLPGAALAGAWKLWLTLHSVPANDDFGPLTVGAFLKNVPKAPDVASRMIGELANRDHWSLLWAGFAAACLLAVVSRHRPHSRLRLAALFAVVCPLAIDGVVFLLSDPRYYELHLSGALARLVLQTVPLAWVATVAVVGTAGVRGRD